PRGRALAGAAPPGGRRRRRPLPRGSPRPGPAAGRPAGPELVAPAPVGGLDGRAARDTAGQRDRAVRPQRAPEAADAPRAHARQAHRQRLGRRGAVLPPLQDDAAPHTNMAKAALNMMTRTSAADYHADGIHMNTVDT